MFQQDIMQSLSDMFSNVDTWSSIGGLSQGDIAGRFADKYDLSSDDVQADMFQQISPEMLKAGQWKTYSPMVEAQGQSLMQDLMKQLTGSQATQAAGGFAGSGGFQKQQSAAKDVYGKSMIDVLSGAKQQQSKGLGNIQDIINQWHQSAQRIKGY